MCDNYGTLCYNWKTKSSWSLNYESQNYWYGGFWTSVSVSRTVILDISFSLAYTILSFLLTKYLYWTKHTAKAKARKFKNFERIKKPLQKCFMKTKTETLKKISKYFTWKLQLKVDFHLVKNVTRTTISFCLRSSRMEPRRNVFNFNNLAVARPIFCTKWKSTFIGKKQNIFMHWNRIFDSMF